jgi:hypothetical protein
LEVCERGGVTQSEGVDDDGIDSYELRIMTVNVLTALERHPEVRY